MLAVDDVVGGRYVVEAQIGAGGQATVYRLRHLHLGSTHAMKVVAAATPEHRERILREGRAQAALRHPHIVRVTDVVEVGGSPALILDLVNGADLGCVIRERRLTLAQVDALVDGLLRGDGHSIALGARRRWAIAGRPAPRVPDVRSSVSAHRRSRVHPPISSRPGRPPGPRIEPIQSCPGGGTGPAPAESLGCAVAVVAKGGVGGIGAGRSAQVEQPTWTHSRR